MLVYETEGILLQRPLLVAMINSDPENQLLKLRLGEMDAKLDTNHKQLMSCSEQQMDRNLRLTTRCMDAAKIIHTNKNVLALANKLEQKQSGIRKQKEQLAQIQSNEVHEEKLTLARNLLEQHSYNQVINVLQPILLASNNDQEVNTLMDEAIAGRDLQVLRLIRRGDQLYREEKIQEAVKVWKLAAKLYPDSLAMYQRLETANNVIQTLDVIRSKK